jgi:hypothetical protein
MRESTIEHQSPESTTLLKKLLLANLARRLGAARGNQLTRILVEKKKSEVRVRNVVASVQKWPYPTLGRDGNQTRATG